jgi:pilus assembly protein CpaB
VKKMTVKKIWLLASVFGFMMASILYLYLSSEETKPVVSEIETESKLSDELGDELAAEENTVVLDIPENKRAFSVPVNSAKGVSGYIKPGSYVDVVAIVSSPDSKGISSRVLLENIRVLAVGSQSEVSEENAESLPNAAYQTVTLEVFPHEGAALLLASEQGVISLMLRAEGDHLKASHQQVTLDQVSKGELPK